MRLSHLVSFALAIALHVFLWDRGREIFEREPVEQTKTALILPLEFRQDPPPDVPPIQEPDPEPDSQPDPEPDPDPSPTEPTARDTDPNAELENRVYATEEAGGGPTDPEPQAPEPLTRQLREPAPIESPTPEVPLERPSRPEPAPRLERQPLPDVDRPRREPSRSQPAAPTLSRPEPVQEPAQERASRTEPSTAPGEGEGIANFPLPPSLMQGPPRAELRFDRYAADFEQNLRSLGGRILVLPREQPRYYLELRDGVASRAVRHTVADGSYAPRAVALEDIPRFRRLRDTVAANLGLSSSKLTIGFELPSDLDTAMQRSKSRAMRAHGLDPSRTRAVVADPTKDPRNPLDVRFFLLEDGRRMRAHPNF